MQKLKLMKVFEPVEDENMIKKIKIWHSCLEDGQERERFYEDGEGRLYRIRGKFFHRTMGIFSKAEIIVCENGTLKGHEIPAPKEPSKLVDLLRPLESIARGD